MILISYPRLSISLMAASMFTCYAAEHDVDLNKLREEVSTEATAYKEAKTRLAVEQARLFLQKTKLKQKRVNLEQLEERLSCAMISELGVVVINLCKQNQYIGALFEGISYKISHNYDSSNGGQEIYKKRTLAGPKVTYEEITQEQFRNFQTGGAEQRQKKSYYGHLKSGGWFRATRKKCFLADGSKHNTYETLCPGQDCQIKKDKTERTFSEVKKIYVQKQKPSGIAVKQEEKKD